MMGHSMPILRQSWTNVRKTWVSKNIWVMMASAPASIFFFKYSNSPAYAASRQHQFPFSASSSESI